MAGAPIYGKWTTEKKKQIYDSRIIRTRNLLTFFENENYCPQKFVSASDAGLYGDRGSEEINLQTGKGEGFLSDICRDWESESLNAEIKY